MRSRRRKQNPLLLKMIGVGVLVTAVALPLLAQFGVFKNIQEHYMETQLVNLPPPPPVPKELKAKKVVKAHPKMESHKPANTARSTQKAAPLPVHVAAATSGPVSNNDNSIVNGSGGPPPGTVPVATPAPPVAAPPAPAPDAIAPPATTPAPVPVAPPPARAPEHRRRRSRLGPETRLARRIS